MFIEFCKGKHAPISTIVVGGVATGTWRDSIAYRVFPTGELQLAGRSMDCNQVVEVKDVGLSIMATRLRKSPGLYGMSEEVLKAIWTAIPHHLIVLYENYRSWNYFPGDLKWVT